MATWPTRRNWPKSRVREKTTIAAEQTRKYTSGTPDRRPEREIEARPEQRDRQDQHRDQTRSALPARVSSSSCGSAPIWARRISTSIADAPIRSRPRPLHDEDCSRERHRLLRRAEARRDRPGRRRSLRVKYSSSPSPSCDVTNSPIDVQLVQDREHVEDSNISLLCLDCPPRDASYLVSLYSSYRSSMSRLVGQAARVPRRMHTRNRAKSTGK